MSEKRFTAIELEKKPLQKALQKFNEDLGQYINDDQRNKLGKVLTIIDASISDPEQRKAIKDLVQSQWWGDSRTMSNIAMASPHTDLRGICLLFGFQLYDPSDGSTIAEMDRGDYDEYAAKRYSQVALQE